MQYKIGELRQVCLKMINILFIDAEILVEILIVAAKLEDEEMKKLCFDYIKRYIFHDFLDDHKNVINFLNIDAIG